jgi:hypothetical protein
MYQNLRYIVERLYAGLLSLYPPRFRETFAEEIQDIFERIVNDARDAENFELLALYFYELKSLVVSIIREQWHEIRSGKEKNMAPENNLHDAHPLQNGEAFLATVGIPDWRWVLRWTLLMTAAIPAGWLLTAPITALVLFIISLGPGVGMLSGINGETLEPVGFFIGLALTYSTSQWLLLRNYLPRTQSWIPGTGIGFLAAGILIGSAVSILDNFNVNPSLFLFVYFLLIGASIGVAQWMVLRKMLKNAFWILVIDVIAAGSFLLSGSSFTSLIELLVFLLLPGLVTGIGIWILLKRSQPSIAVDERGRTPVAVGHRSRKWPWILAGTAGLIPLFFIFSWVYAISQIELAKDRGIYTTPEEAVIARNSQGWGGAEVVKVEGVHASPNSFDGSQPHVWFGGCKVYLDRIPAGWDRNQYESGSYYIHVREGWVHVPEGAFPEFIGWAMELYNLEDVNEWKMENNN